VKDFDNAAVLIYPIVHMQRTVQKPPHASLPLHRNTHRGKRCILDTALDRCSCFGVNLDRFLGRNE